MEFTCRKATKRYSFIPTKQSEQNAQKVTKKILDTIDTLHINPERFGLDQYKIANDGSYRYLEIYRFRVAFRIYKNNIRILRIRSTDQETLVY